MAEFPALTLWTDAYLSDTRSLSTLEHGAYLLLLMEAWRRPNCDLPNDDAILARLTGLNFDEWMEIRETILSFWTFDGRSKTFKQKRLMFERDRARVRSKSARDKAAKRWDKTKDKDTAALPGECPDDAPTAHCSLLTGIGEESPPPEELDAREKSKRQRGPYAFEGETIKLNQADLDRWKKSFHAIPDIVAELHALDAWFQGDQVADDKRANWFRSVPGMLSRKHQEMISNADPAGQREWEFTGPC